MTPYRRAAAMVRAEAVWFVRNFDVYAVLCRPDGSAAARFHVIAEAEMACRAINEAEEKEAIVGETEVEHDAVHGWFNLTYASYLVLPRSVLQSMPDEWQSRFVACLRDLGRACDEAGIAEAVDGPWRVQRTDAKGRTRADPLMDYERGRRNVFAEFTKAPTP